MVVWRARSIRAEVNPVGEAADQLPVTAPASHADPDSAEVMAENSQPTQVSSEATMPLFVGVVPADRLWSPQTPVMRQLLSSCFRSVMREVHCGELAAGR